MSHSKFTDILESTDLLVSNKTKGLIILLIYNEADPGIRKMLADDYYVDGLKEITEPNLFLFYFEDRLKEDSSTRKMMYSHNLENGIKLNEAYSYLLNTLSNFKITPKYPSLLITQLNNNKISDHIFIELKSNSLEEFYSELKELLVKMNSVINSLKYYQKIHRYSMFIAVKKYLIRMNYRFLVIKSLKKISEFISMLRLALKFF